MHGLVNKSLQSFLRDTYGAPAWDDVVRRADLDVASFEAMLIYDDDLTYRTIDAASKLLGKTREVLLEDLGTYLISHPAVDAVRRLLRFGGVNFEDFLHSLDDLPDRVRLAVPDLELPDLELRPCTDGQYALTVVSSHPGFSHVMVGVLRAMADDYGALVLLDHEGGQPPLHNISIRVLESSFAQARAFSLAREAR